MPLDVACPSCKSGFRVADQHLGKQANCPKCGDRFVIEGRPDARSSNANTGQSPRPPAPPLPSPLPSSQHSAGPTNASTANSKRPSRFKAIVAALRPAGRGKVVTLVGGVLAALVIALGVFSMRGHLGSRGSVRFELEGVRMGEPMTETFASKHHHEADRNKPKVHGTYSFKLDGNNVFVSYDFRQSKLAAVGIVFDSYMFLDVVQVYTEKLGSPPHEISSERATWITDQGPFLIQKFDGGETKGIGTIMTQVMSQEFLDQEKAHEKAVKEELKSNL